MAQKPFEVKEDWFYLIGMAVFIILLFVAGFEVIDYLVDDILYGAIGQGR